MKYIFTVINALKESSLFIFLFVYMILWHVAIIVIAPDVTFLELGNNLVKTLYLYVLVAFLSAVLIGIVCSIAGTGLRRSLTIAIIVLFSFFTGIRALDWATVYFSGMHVNREFWYHAFYVDGATFFFTVPSFVLIVLGIAITVVFIVLLRRLIASVKSSDSGNGLSPRLFVSLLKNNGIAAACIVLCAAPLFLNAPLQEGSSKFMFVRIPEYEVLSSFFQYMNSTELNETQKLDQSIVDKLRKAGVPLYTMDEKYPLLKKSIYADPADAHANKPRIAGRPNVIIVISESMNQFFVQEEIHGVKDLTGNYRDFMKQSIYFTNVLCTITPTVRGTIAALGSSMYMIDKVQGLTKKGGIRPPLLTRFLFLSDVLKKRGYTNIHIQGGSGLFVGLRDAFENRQSYDKFIGWENLELQKFSKGTTKKDWGIRDEDIFKFAKKMLEEGRIKEPFLLTISTLDMHPPYDPLHKHPQSEGNILLNSLYSSDKAFGTFWDYYKKSRFRDNTIFVVIADHVTINSIDFRKFYSKYKNIDESIQYFVFLAMHIPRSQWNGKEVPTMCTNLDLTPTLLDVMGIDTVNPFLGMSIFTERPKFPMPLIVGHYQKMGFILNRLTDNERKFIKSIGWTEDDQQKFSSFLEQLALKRAIYPDPK